MTITIQKNLQADAIEWLMAEYPRGLDLVYVDYRDCFEDMDQLQKVLKGDGDDFFSADDGSYEMMDEVIKNYCREKSIDISDEVRESMIDWMREHDTSDPMRELLKNTGSQLFYIETPDYSEEEKGNAKELQNKYAKTPEQKKDIQITLDNQFYGAPVSFYFYADVEDVYNAIINKSQEKYITVEGAYFSTIDRVQGSNWLGNDGIFTLSIPWQAFIDNIFLDEAKGNGYGWGSIAGQSKSSYTEAEVYGSDTQKRGTIRLLPKVSDCKKTGTRRKHARLAI